MVARLQGVRFHSLHIQLDMGPISGCCKVSFELTSHQHLPVNEIHYTALVQPPLTTQLLCNLHPLHSPCASSTRCTALVQAPPTAQPLCKPHPLHSPCASSTRACTAFLSCTLLCIFSYSAAYNIAPAMFYSQTHYLHILHTKQVCIRECGRALCVGMAYIA